MASENQGQTTQQEVKTAANNTAKGAKAIKAASSAAGKAASGNLVGAGIDILKNETTRRAVTASLIFLLIFPIFVAAALPMTIYGSLEKFVEDTQKEMPKEAANNNDPVEEVIYDIPKALEDGTKTYSSNEKINETWMSRLDKWFSSIFGWWTSKKGTDDGSDEIDEYIQDYNYLITAHDDDPSSDTQTSDGYVDYSTNSIIDYLDLVLERYSKRRDNYEEMLKVIEASFDSSPHTAYYSSGCESWETSSVFISPTLNRSDSINYLSVYGVQRGDNGLNNLEAKSLVAWLGTYDRNQPYEERKDKYFVSDGSTAREFRCQDWKGDTLPQYLYEEIQEQQTYAAVNKTKFEVPAAYSAYSFSFIQETYIITDIHVEYYIDARQRWVQDPVTGNWGWETYYVFVQTVVMTAEQKEMSEIEGDIIGFWQGSFKNGGVPAKEDHGENWGSRVWNSPVNGKQFGRLYDYQCEYVDPMSETSIPYYTALWLGDEIYATSASWYSPGYIGTNGAYTTIDLKNIPYVDPNDPTIARIVDLAQKMAQPNRITHGWDIGVARGTDWCAGFQTWLRRQMGLSVPPNCLSTHGYWEYFGGQGSGYSVTGSGGNSHGTAYAVKDTVISGNSSGIVPQPGDLVIFGGRKNGQIITKHIGMVYSFDPDSFMLYTIEGNTGSSDNTKSTVMIRERIHASPYNGGNIGNYNILGIIRPNYGG